MIIERGTNGCILSSTGGKRVRFCPKGHDKDTVGRDKNRRCEACSKLYAKAYNGGNKRRESRWQACGIKTTDGNRFTVADFDWAYAAQQGKCAVCGAHQDKFGNRLAVDHDHTTGLFRGLLCSVCNTGLGRKEDVVWNAKADLYLKLSKEIQNV